jgi:hypothetical protein
MIVNGIANDVCWHAIILRGGTIRLDLSLRHCLTGESFPAENPVRFQLDFDECRS